MWRPTFLNNKKNNFIQPENRNRAMLNFAASLGFSMPSIRKALIVLNEIKLKDIKGHPSTVSNSLTGVRITPAGKRATAGVLDLNESELYPPEAA